MALDEVAALEAIKATLQQKRNLAQEEKERLVDKQEHAETLIEQLDIHITAINERLDALP
jgi:hypothetical protein